MKCSTHPGKDTISHCSMCRVPLCEQCTAQDRSVKTLCHRCEMLQLVRDGGREKKERKEKLKIQEDTKETQKEARKRLYQMLSAGLGVCVLIINLFMYQKFRIPESENPDLTQHSLSAVVLIDSAVRSYAIDHNGHVPGSLEELLERYLPSNLISPDDLSDFAYKKTSPKTYALRSNHPASEDMPIFVFTDKGPQ